MQHYGKITIHFDGEIITNHEIPLHVLAKTLTKLEAAINRAYLVVKRGTAEKHRRMGKNDYPAITFLIGKSSDGGYILDLAANTPIGKTVISYIGDCLSHVIDNLNSDMDTESYSLSDQLNDHKKTFDLKTNIQTYEEFHKNNNENNIHYATKSILKEFPEFLIFIEQKDKYGENYFDITFEGKETIKVSFDAQKAALFKQVIREVHLAPPVLYEGTIQSLNKQTKAAKFVNKTTKRVVMLKILTDEDFIKVHPYLIDEDGIRFYGCPLVEYGSIDTIGGDIYFLDLANTAE
ncbi:hypothetical protein LWC08_02905 [Desulfobaculum bizertense]|uniref:hypothetical protein n=1 Tax=Desulfobaculum bizertense TaxID=376490 RepID=UPI001F2C6570|nr:hypothetical protein [Desulfobaculum bizertense]UIJ38534.1 hypothetical protein LWC08_02905 [Desulfobaculum bizertense]